MEEFLRFEIGAAVPLEVLFRGVEGVDTAGEETLTGTVPEEDLVDGLVFLETRRILVFG